MIKQEYNKVLISVLAESKWEMYLEWYCIKFNYIVDSEIKSQVGWGRLGEEDLLNP